MKKPEITPVVVDMVPLIDIVSLLLMFLIVIGDTTANSSSLKMKLPAASEALKDSPEISKNRIVVQLGREDNTYFAQLSSRKHDMSDNGLKKHLAQIVDDAAREKWIAQRDDGTWNMDVKLRIPEDYPMPEVEKVLSTVRNLGLCDIHYAAVKK